MTESASGEGRHWVPLESNPEVLTKYIRELGVQGAEFTDVFGLDDELLAMVPSPVHAVLMLFPITDDTEESRIAEEPTAKQCAADTAKSVYFVTQTIENACGTIACIHSVCNSRGKVAIAKGSFFDKLVTGASAFSTGAERAKALDRQCDELGAAHEAAAHEGQTEEPDEDECIVLHFVAFVEVDGVLYELDGRRAGPMPRGPTSKETILKDAARVVKAAVEKNPDDMRFTLLALVDAQSPQ